MSSEISSLVSITDRARETVLELRASEPDADRLALWLEITGATGGMFTYDLYFGLVSDASSRDRVEHFDGLALVIPAASIPDLAGSVLDLSDAQGLVVVNPNRPAEPAAPVSAAATGDLSSEVAQRVLEVLDEEINPAIAAHGGRADLVSVDGSIAYVRLSGGCQGCGMAAVTLGQGIEVAIKEMVPEILSVVDVTDHAGGSNPYFEAAKK
jgi:Fe/S biogenesis protein NfuA